MFERVRKSFSREKSSLQDQRSERRSYLNMREFLDDLDVKSSVSQAESDGLSIDKRSFRSRFGSRKQRVLNIFTRTKSHGNTSLEHSGLRSVSMVMNQSNCLTRD